MPRHSSDQKAISLALCVLPHQPLQPLQPLQAAVGCSLEDVLQPQCLSLSASASAPARPPPWRIVYGQRYDQARHQRRASSEVIRPMRVMQIVQLRSHRPHCLCPRHTTDPAVARICSGLTPHARAPKARRARMVADGRKFAQSRPLRKEQRTQRTG